MPKRWEAAVSAKLVSRRQEELWMGAIVLSGASAWAAMATMAGLRRVQISIIELLFSFAPLVIVPLGLELAGRLERAGSGRTYSLRLVLPIAATAAACLAVLLRPGHAAAWFGVPWVVYCACLVCERGRRRNRTWSLTSFILDIAYVDLAIGAVWFVISRAGLRPFGFQEPIILLTAVHFHYSGYGTALVAAATLKWFEMHGLRSQPLRWLLLLLALLPFAVAAGFVLSPALRFLAALLFVACLGALTRTLLSISSDMQNWHARLYLRLAAGTVAASLAFAGMYAVSECFGKGWITIARMANTHGVLNSLGFVLFGISGWLIELYASVSTPTKRTTVPRRKDEVLFSGGAREHFSGIDPSSVPEFVARDFYDR